MKDKLKLIEDISYYGGMIISAIGLVLSLNARRGLAEGACPVEHYRNILITGIVLFLISLVVGFIRNKAS